MDEDQIRVFDVIIEDARLSHRAIVAEMDDPTYIGHSALTEKGDDINCLECGHINEAEYELAELKDNLNESLWMRQEERKLE